MSVNRNVTVPGGRSPNRCPFASRPNLPDPHRGRQPADRPGDRPGALQFARGRPAVRPGSGAPKVVPGVEGQKIILSSELLSPAMQKAMIEEWRSVFGLQ